MLAPFANTDYRDKFWPSRRYEDQCDRIALRALLPPSGNRLIDVGAGFGRLANEYSAYPEVVLLDRSEAMIGSARVQLAADPRFTFVSGVAEQLPFPDRSFDAVVCVRVLHHIGDPRPAIAEFARVLRPGGVLVLEAANKRNLKAVVAHLLRRQRSSPFGRGSVPYQPTSLVPRPTRHAAQRAATMEDEQASAGPWTSPAYLHAPIDIRAWLAESGFMVKRSRSVGLLRPGVVTSHVPGRLLAGLERLLQPALAAPMPAPSMFVAAVRRLQPEAAPRPTAPGGEA